MPFSDDLVQHIHVKGKIQGNTSKGGIPAINQFRGDVTKLVKGKLNRAVHGVGEEVGTTAKYEQHAGIMHYRAIFTHRLWNSIQNKRILSSQTEAKYDVATTIYDKYPLILIKGRKSVRPVRKKALRFKLTPNGDYRFATFVKPAKKKDYMNYSHKHTYPKINGVVKKYVDELFR